MQNVVTTESLQAFKKKKIPQNKTNRWKNPHERCEKLKFKQWQHFCVWGLLSFKYFCREGVLLKSVASSWISCEPFLLFLLRFVRELFLLPISIMERWLNWSFPSGKVYVRTISQRIIVTFSLQGGWQFLYFVKDFLSWNLVLQFITCEIDLFWRSVFSYASCIFERKVEKKNTRDHKTLITHGVIQQEIEGQEKKVK